MIFFTHFGGGGGGGIVTFDPLKLIHAFHRVSLEYAKYIRYI